MNNKNNWSTLLNETVYTYTITNNKLVYVQDYKLFISDPDNKNKTQLFGKDGSSTVLFGIAGDWIIARSSSDVGMAKITLINLIEQSRMLSFKYGIS